MPSSVVAAIAAYLMEIGITSVVLANAIATVIVMVASYALTAALTPKPKMNSRSLSTSLQQNLVSVRQPISYWQYIYGRARVPGVMTYACETTDNQFHLIYTFAGHVSTEIEEIWFGNEIIPLNVDGLATGKYAGHVKIQKSLGDESGQPFPDLVTATTGVADGEWTNAHRQTGRTKIYVRLLANPELFPQNIPNITAVIKGKKVYDPVTATFIWSDCPSLCQADYAVDIPGGLEVDYADEIEEDVLIASAAIDNETVLIEGGSEKRFTCNGFFEINGSPPAENMAGLLTANNGTMRYIGGQFFFETSTYYAPTIDIDESDLRDVPNIEPMLSAEHSFNGVKGTYASEANFWQATDYPSATNSTFLTADQGLPAWKELTLYFTKSPSMAQRISKIELYKNRQQIIVNWPGMFTCYRLRAGNTVRVSFAPLGWVNKVFEVVATSLAMEIKDQEGGCTLGVDLTLRETSSTSWDWDYTTDDANPDPAPNTTLPDPFGVTPPTVLVLTNGTTVLSDGTVIPYIKATWTPSNYPFTTGWEVRYKRSVDGSWQTRFVTNPVFVIQPVEVGEDYDIQVFTKTILTKSQTALSNTGHTATGVSVTPISANALTATGGLFQISLAWTFPASSRKDFSHIEIFAATVNNRASATRISIVLWPELKFIHTGLQPAQNRYYWIRLIDTSGNAGGFFPTSATAGVNGVPSSDASSLLTMLIDGIGLDHIAADLSASLSGAVADADAALTAADAATTAVSGVIAKNYSRPNIAGGIDTWARDGSFNLVTGDNQHGTYIQCSAPTVALAQAYSRLISCDTGRTYTLTGDTVASVTGTVNMYFNIIFYNASDVYISEASSPTKSVNHDFKTDDSGRNFYAFQATAPAGAAKMRARFIVHDVTGNSNLGFRQPKLEVGPLPATTFSSENEITDTRALVYTEQTARASADSAEATARQLVAATVLSRPNICPPLQDWTYPSGFVITNETAFGEFAYHNTQTGTFSCESPFFAVYGSNVYTITGDSQFAGTSGLVYFDIIYYDASDAVVLDGPQAVISGQHFFTVNDANRIAHQSQSTAPSTAVKAKARFVCDTLVGTTSIAFRQVKVELGALPATKYTQEKAMAAVQTLAEATADSVGNVLAKYAVKVDAGGKVAGIELMADGTTSAMVILADKLYMVKADGTGTPKPIMVVGDINGTPTFGFNGNAIIDGTIVASSLAADSVTASKIDVTSLSAITATIGLLRTASSGARMEIEDDVIRVFDSSGTLRVKLGNLA